MKNMFLLIWESLRYSFSYQSEIIKKTLSLYCLTLAIPLASTLCLIIASILGILQISFLEGLRMFWVDYYFAGTLCGIEAYRWHLALLFMCFLYTIMEEE